MNLIKVKFLKAAGGYAYFPGDIGYIKESDLERLLEYKAVELLTGKTKSEPVESDKEVDGGKVITQLVKSDLITYIQLGIMVITLGICVAILIANSG